MEKSLFSRLNSYFDANYIAKGEPTTELEIRQIENSLECILNEQFKEFTLKFGGCLIGDIEIYGMHNSELLGDDTIITINKEMTKFLKKGQLLFSIDYSGNPIYIDESGSIIFYDHDIDKYSEIEKDFYHFINSSLIKVGY